MKFVQIVEEPGWNRRVFRGGRLTRKREVKDSLGGPFAALPLGCAASPRTCRSSRFFLQGLLTRSCQYSGQRPELLLSSHADKSETCRASKRRRRDETDPSESEDWSGNR